MMTSLAVLDCADARSHKVIVAMSDLATLEHNILTDIAAASDEAALEAVRVAALGKKGSISALLATLGKMSPDERKTQGAAINLAKDKVTQALTARRDILKSAALDARLASETIDVTLPLRETPAEAGRIHPLSQVIDEVNTIFADMGFCHRRRSRHRDRRLQFHQAEFPRRPSGAGDARHVLLQSEGRRLAHAVAHPHLAGAGAHHADARSRRSASSARAAPIASIPTRPTRRSFTRSRASSSTRARISATSNGSCTSSARRSSRSITSTCGSGRRSFPFTEPSLEVDIQCRRDKGEIRFGEGEDWLEILGCGMVHPNVLRACGIDPDVYQGFAWGMGIDRIAMLKYGMSDLRQLFESDVRWLTHYGFKPLDVPTLAGGLSS